VSEKRFIFHCKSVSENIFVISVDQYLIKFFYYQCESVSENIFVISIISVEKSILKFLAKNAKGN
jgi:hypothetical protein